MSYQQVPLLFGTPCTLWNLYNCTATLIATVTVNNLHVNKICTYSRFMDHRWHTEIAEILQTCLVEMVTWPVAKALRT